MNAQQVLFAPKKITLILFLLLTIRSTHAQLPGCATTINSFPYFEGFEAGLGNWTNNTTGDQFDWTRDSGGTPSSATGPGTGSGSTWYMYIETSGGSSGNEAWLESDCFNFTTLINPNITFDYHMYGSSMGTLELLISTNGTAWTSLWSLTGNQGNSWNTANINLAAYAGQTVGFRFRGVRGTSYQGDASIDNINIYNTAPMTYVSSTCTHVNTSNVEVCASDQDMIRIEVATTGNLSPIDLTQLVVRTDGSTSALTDIANIDVYYTGTNSTFSTPNLFGNAAPLAPGNDITINGTQTLREGTNYFWVVYDLNLTSTVGNNIDVLCNNITIDASNYTPTTPSPTGNRALVACNRICPMNATVFSDDFETGSWVQGVITSATYGSHWTGLPRTGSGHMWMNIRNGLSDLDVYRRRFDQYYMNCDVTIDYWTLHNSIGFDADYILTDDNGNVIDSTNVVTTAADVNIYQNRTVTFTPTTPGVSLRIHCNSTGGPSNDIALDDFQIIQCCVIPLPVELLSFEFECQKNFPELKWTTTTEINNDYYTIERSTDMVNFIEVARISGSGNSSDQTFYKWTDYQPENSTNYYRLKQTDFDGNSKYLETIAADCLKNSKISIYPNPMQDQLTITLGKSYENVSITVKNVLGQVVRNKTYKSIQNIELSLNEAKGLYVVSISNDIGEEIYHNKIMKQ